MKHGIHLLLKTKLFAISAIILLLISCSSSNSESKGIQKVENEYRQIGLSDYWQDYSIIKPEYGTKTIVTIKNNNRNIVSNALPNHPTGEFPNDGNPNTISAQDVKYTIPLNPKLSGESKWVREPGVAINGVKFEPETAERFVCETGEVYRIEAFQEWVDMGLDFNHAHVQPTGAYHYHGVPTGLVEALDTEEDIVHVGFAKDGFAIYYSQSGKYKPSFQLANDPRTGDACSYNNPHQSMDKILNNTQPDGTFVSDWEYVAAKGDLDECNGIVVDGQYTYFVTDEYPYMSRCLKGEFKEDRRKGPPPGGHSHNGQRPHNH